MLSRICGPSLVALVLASCGGGGDVGDASTDAPNSACVLSASSYATTCTADSDCAPVWVGDACTSPCFCHNASISASSKPKYQADFDATNHENNVCTCSFPDAICCNGTCALGCP